MNIRTGQGIDFHKLEEGRELWLGGINIPFSKGCVAHSDGDVLLHALCDAMLGAAGLNDIGHYFPDTASEFKNIDSKILLGKTNSIISEKGYRLVNADCTVCLEKPRIAPYIDEMKRAIAKVLDTETDRISVKATTTEKMGFTGRGEGIIAISSVLLEKI
jgi:2-C-methyl-D-erythritol 2,4-cyclodiphosphate synthase